MNTFRSVVTVSIKCIILAAGLAATPIPFDPERGLVEVQVLLDGRVQGKFGFDTGADRLYIDRAFAKKNGLSFAEGAPSHQVAGIDGVAQSSAVSIRSMEIGDERLYNLPAVAIDLNDLTHGKTGNHPDGLIGFDILRRFYLTIDYPNRTADMYMAEPKFLAGRNFETVPFKQFNHLIIVEARFTKDIVRPMVLDYCASITSISQKLAKELELGVDSRGIGVIPSIALDGGIQVEMIPATVANIEAYRRNFRGAEFEGIIGATFLRNFKVTVDYKRNRVYFHHNS